MNHFQLLLKVLAESYSQDEIISMVILKYKQTVDASISYATVRRNLLQPVTEWRNFTDHFITALAGVVGKDIRVIFTQYEKEQVIV